VSMLAFLGFALKVVAPSFGQVLFGIGLRRFGVLNETRVQQLSRIMFVTGMPVVMFMSAAGTDLDGVLESRYLAAGVVATLINTLMAVAYARWRGFSLPDSGVFAQGAYRSNMGFIGIALCANAYGAQGLQLAALPLAVWTTLYNIIAVWLLNQTHGRSVSAAALIRGMLTNPLIVSISIGLLVSALGIRLPAWLVQSGRVFTLIFLPCVLVLVGAAISLQALRGASVETVESCSWKLFLTPLIAVLIALLMDVQGIELAVLFLMLASPTATSSFIMVAGVGGNVAMAANIVVLTTLGSGLSITLGLFLLQLLGLV